MNKIKEKKLDQIRKKYSDARHNCYAYIVYDNESKTKIEKSSDDRTKVELQEYQY